MTGLDAFYNDRNDTLTISIDGNAYTLTSKDAWRLLDLIETSLIGPSLVADHRGD